MSEAGQCRRCGACCMQGGPALHGPDLALLHGGHLQPEDLITVRRGELAVQPLRGEPEPVVSEFLKLTGKHGSWCCAFYDEADKGCRRYTHRPMACGLLNCTDTTPLLALAGKDLLSRFDCIAADDPLLPLVREYEGLCPCPDLQAIRDCLCAGKMPAEQLAELEALVCCDLNFRGRITAEFALSLGRELFYFGRPIFQLFGPLGLEAVNTPTGIHLLQNHR
ncbi:MAG: YkgJ family cysteine cluster protein [Desulfobulbus sp.]|nr:YkgJ family cysteine cluster protein [Desulfobulbus sp.]